MREPKSEPPPLGASCQCIGLSLGRNDGPRRRFCSLFLPVGPELARPGAGGLHRRAEPGAGEGRVLYQLGLRGAHPVSLQYILA